MQASGLQQQVALFGVLDGDWPSRRGEKPTALRGAALLYHPADL